ncbi:MAG: hypothetical protein M1824_002457 [Vezdaea acicularis]|nr:MAG: hypothetical protein M1824_002457 [Vezdaea acicularis]
MAEAAASSRASIPSSRSSTQIHRTKGSISSDIPQHGSTEPLTSSVSLDDERSESDSAEAPLLSHEIVGEQPPTTNGIGGPPRKPEDIKDDKPVTWMSLPHKPQLFILAVCRLSEPLSNTCLLPYLYYLVRSLQPQSDSSSSISRSAGVVVALFALSQFATSMAWAKAADAWGRKPVILIGLMVSIFANLGFGFSKSIPAIMCWRIVAGCANGNTGVMRTMTAEIVKDKKYQSRAFLLLPLVFNSGVIIGLFLGGFLADPVKHMAWAFGPHGLFNFPYDAEGVAWMRKYPYALPTVFNAMALTCSLLLAICGLKETSSQKAGRTDYGLLLGRIVRRNFSRYILRNRSSGYAVLSTHEHGSDDEHELEKAVPKPAIKAVDNRPFPPSSTSVWTSDVLATLLAFALLWLHNSAFMQLFPVFLSVPHNPNEGHSVFFFNGGLSLPSSSIGFVFSLFGVYGIFLQLMIYPRLHARFGTLGMLRIAFAMFPFAYVPAPYLALFSDTGGWKWFGICFILFIQVTARTFAIPSSVILLTNVAPRPQALSTIHGAGNTLTSLARAVGPAIGGYVLARGIDEGVVGLVWWAFLTVVGVVGIVWSFRMRQLEKPEKGRGGGKGA